MALKYLQLVLGLGICKDQSVVNIVHEALDIGYRHIDCASMYENEIEVGKGIINSGVDREEILLLQKLIQLAGLPSMGNGPFLKE